MTQLEKVVQKLPPALQEQVLDYARYLLDTKVEEKSASHRARHLKLTWAGGLKEYKEHYTSLALQKQSLNWWN